MTMPARARPPPRRVGGDANPPPNAIRARRRASCRRRTPRAILRTPSPPRSLPRLPRTRSRTSLNACSGPSTTFAAASTPARREVRGAASPPDAPPSQMSASNRSIWGRTPRTSRRRSSEVGRPIGRGGGGRERRAVGRVRGRGRDLAAVATGGREPPLNPGRVRGGGRGGRGGGRGGCGGRSAPPPVRRFDRAAASGRAGRARAYLSRPGARAPAAAAAVAAGWPPTLARASSRRMCSRAFRDESSGFPRSPPRLCGERDSGEGPPRRRARRRGSARPLTATIPTPGDDGAPLVALGRTRRARRWRCGLGRGGGRGGSRGDRRACRVGLDASSRPGVRGGGGGRPPGRAERGVGRRESRAGRPGTSPSSPS